MIAVVLTLAPSTLAVAAAVADRSVVAITPVCAANGTLMSIKVADQTVDDPLSPRGTARIKELVPPSDARLVVAGDTVMPYRCIGALIYSLQVLGYAKIGFISEPPPARHLRR